MGEKWHESIQAAITECDCGILLVSTAFLASKYIGREELPRFLASKLVIPVALKPFRFDGMMDLQGLEARQIFHDGGKSFEQRINGRTKDGFCSELFAAIVRRLDDHFGNKPDLTEPAPPRMDRQRDDLEHELHDVHFTPPHEIGRASCRERV